MKFVMSHKRAGKFREAEKLASRAALQTATEMSRPTATRIKDFVPRDELARRSIVMEGSPADMQALAVDSDDDVIVEPLILHHTLNTALGIFSDALSEPASHGFPAGTGNSAVISARGNGMALSNAKVYLITRTQFGDSRVFEGATDTSGEAQFQYGPFFHPLYCVVVPYSGFWARQLTVTGARTTVLCDPLPSNQRIDWWHRSTGYRTYDETAGNGIRVGVIDTGFGPHPHLIGTNEGAFVDNAFQPAGGNDVDVHGSHVAGTIAGRPGGDLNHSGVAPGVELHAVRVFPADRGAANVDIANAIDFLSRERQCDLINMSLGAPTGSAIIRDAVQDARERGTLCICAAANSSGPVEFPAAFPECVAISALGMLGEAPDDSVSGTQTPGDPNLFAINRMFFAKFSCFGVEIDATAPGVGIVAPVPERHGLTKPYAALDGTSMASPVACGTLARDLSRNRAYLSMGRDINRADMARAILRDLCCSIGLPRVNEGFGLPVS